jgi:gas vesicle protein
MRAELGFLAGLGAGVTVGLLFAPKSGKQTKHLIAQKARSGIGQVSAAGQKLRAQAVSLADEARERVTEVVEAGKEAYSRAKGKRLVLENSTPRSGKLNYAFKPTAVGW